MPILRYIVVPLVIFWIACYFFWETAKRYPAWVIGAVSLWIIVVLIRMRRQKKRDVQRGWRVGHVGRDSMYYEELRDGAWRRIAIEGELLDGKAHHVIYFRSLNFPDWASGRSEEIIGRIKSEFHPPQYEYDET